MKIEGDAKQTSRGAKSGQAAPRTVGSISSVNSLASLKYHRAAIDGYVDMLCDASKRDTNSASDELNGLTPTLLAAYTGQLEALRILVGRGGDPERTAPDGSSGLHLAAARNHLSCVSFLVNFGVNMWTLDNELRTAKDVAAIEQRKEILDYLDRMMAKQSALNTKNVQKLKEKAKVAAEKRLKQLRKAQMKAIKQVEKDERFLVKLSNSRRLLRAAHSISDIKLVGKQQADGGVAPKPLRSPLGPRLASSASVTSLVNCTRLTTVDQLGRVHQATSNKLPLPFQANQHISSDRKSQYSSSSGYLSSVASSRLRAKFSDANNSRPKYSDLVAIQASDSPARKKAASSSSSCNSSVATRLRAIGGVSRKVHLKRLLTTGASHSTSELRAQEPASEPLESPGGPCGVQPASKAQLPTGDQAQLVGGDRADSSGTIKWPPAPTLSRTISEPDFGAAARLAKEEDSTPAKTQPSGRPTRESGQAERQCQSQQQLLTQCLSQLKRQHEAICSKQQDNTTRVSSAARGENSDELLQHQLNAGQFPLRPSLIKQHNSSATNQSKPAERSATTIISVDSIGSAGSLAQRSSPSASSKSSSTIGSGSQSSCASSSSYSSVGMRISMAKPATATSTSMSAHSIAPDQTGADSDSIESFLKLNGLDDLSGVFAREKIDLEALMLLSEEDLISLNVLLGPRRKLMRAIENRRQLMTAVSPSGSRIPLSGLCMVDTQL